LLRRPWAEKEAPQVIKMHNPPDGRAELEQLAEALSQRGYDATVITPAPCLAIRIPGTPLPQMIYTNDGQLWRNTAQATAPAAQTTRAAETITWALRASHASPAHGTTSPLATTPGQPPASSAGGPQC
jgi:hypothetical protein